MSTGTMERRIEGGDDGTGNVASWEQWEQQMQGGRGYVAKDVGRLANTGSFGGFDPRFRTDRIMPVMDSTPRAVFPPGTFVVNPNRL